MLDKMNSKMKEDFEQQNGQNEKKMFKLNIENKLDKMKTPRKTSKHKQHKQNGNKTQTCVSNCFFNLF